MTFSMRNRFLVPIFFFSFLFPFLSKGAIQVPSLMAVYQQRSDLQNSFDVNGQPIEGGKAGFLLNLEDWARQYGWREHAELAAYAPSEPAPELVGTVPVPKMTAGAFLVMDRRTGTILAEHRGGVPWPIASISKLMTAELVFGQGTPLDKVVAIQKEDEVGGARLAVSPGTTFTVEGLLYAALIGSANNAATALSHATDMDKETFVRAMNERAKEMGLSKTSFFDPSGMDPANVSTPREIAQLATQVFSRQEMRRYTSTASRVIPVLSNQSTKKLTNTNWMIWKPEYDDVYVTSGKTGYLEESGWNLVVSLRPSADDTQRELLLVLFGSESRPDSFKDAKALAKWTWKNA